jgi:hypothetical protein
MKTNEKFLINFLSPSYLSNWDTFVSPSKQMAKYTMIDLTIPTAEQIKKQFNDAKIQGTGKFSPRNGFYYVRAFEYRNVVNRVDVPFIIANWKANREDLFLESAVFEISVSCFPLGNGGYADVSFDTIVGRTVQVYDMALLKQIVNGKEEPLVNGKWMYEFFDHKFHSPSIFWNLMKIVPTGIHIPAADLSIDLTCEPEQDFNEVEDPDDMVSYDDLDN